MRATFKNIIPDLVSIDTPLPHMNGSYLFQNFDFFKPVAEPQRFHYRIAVGNVKPPKTFTFRNGYYKLHDGCWYYERKLATATFTMKYDPGAKSFTFSRSYLRVPIEVGGILPAGKHVADFIHLDLLLNGYTLMRGFAYQSDRSVYAAAMPSCSGKTTMLRAKLLEGARYIAEDILVFNLHTGKIFPTMPLSNNYGRGINKKVVGLAAAQAIDKPLALRQVHFASSDMPQDADSPDSLVLDYLGLNSLLFMDNRLIRAHIFANHLRQQLTDNLTIPKENKVKFMAIPSTQADAINREHWNDLGKRYGDVWKSPAKQVMSNNELQFLSNAAAHVTARTILDIGVGSGRIVNHYLDKNIGHHLYGIDIAPAMIDHCRQRFAGQRRVKDLAVCNIATSELPFSHNFDMISAVRVIKYNKNWQEIVQKLVAQLRPGGVLAFSMTNNKSINKFAKYHIPFERTNIKELQALSAKLGVDIVDIRTFTRIPDALYDMSAHPVYNRLLVGAEKALQLVCGTTALGRELFITFQKPLNAERQPAQ